MSGPHRYAQSLSGLGGFEPGKKAQPNQVGGCRIDQGQLLQRFMEGQQLVVRHRRGEARFRHLHALLQTAALGRLTAAGLVNQDAAHRFGGGGEEVAPAVPVPDLVRAHEPEVGFVDQGGGLQRLPRLLLGQLLGSELPQLVVDQRQQLLGGVRVAMLNLHQNLCYFAHGGNDTPCIRPQRLTTTALVQFSLSANCQRELAVCTQYSVLSTQYSVHTRGPRREHRISPTYSTRRGRRRGIGCQEPSQECHVETSVRAP